MELEDLKKQWEILHQKLEKQQFFNKQLMENTIKQKTKYIANENWFYVLLFLVVIPLTWGFQDRWKLIGGNSFFYFVLISLMFYGIITAYLAWLFDKSMKTANNILLREKTFLKFKKLTYINYAAQTIFALITFVWSIVSTYNRLITSKYALFLIIIFYLVCLLFASRLSVRYLNKINTLHKDITNLKEFEAELKQ